MKKTYLNILNDINPGEQTAMTSYISKAMPLFIKNQGEIVFRSKIIDVILGNAPQILAVISFPNSQIIKDVFNSPEYQTLIEDRDKAFPNMTIFISEDFDPTA
ncbi:MAG: DUF1330 domain-containing protein [Spirochaetaceae bacterium]